MFLFFSLSFFLVKCKPLEVQMSQTALRHPIISNGTFETSGRARRAGNNKMGGGRRKMGNEVQLRRWVLEKIREKRKK